MDKSLQGNFEIDTGVKGGGMGGFFWIWRQIFLKSIFTIM